eukprot:scaffold7584_cov315-Pinguiococcus_pyrenoidosus.AAC.3
MYSWCALLPVDGPDRPVWLLQPRDNLNLTDLVREGDPHHGDPHNHMSLAPSTCEDFTQLPLRQLAHRSRASSVQKRERRSSNPFFGSSIEFWRRDLCFLFPFLVSVLEVFPSNLFETLIEGVEASRSVHALVLKRRRTSGRSCRERHKHCAKRAARASQLFASDLFTLGSASWQRIGRFGGASAAAKHLECPRLHRLARAPLSGATLARGLSRQSDAGHAGGKLAGRRAERADHQAAGPGKVCQEVRSGGTALFAPKEVAPNLN